MKLQKIYVLLIMVLMLILGNSDEAYAAKTLTNPLKIGSFNYVDLDKDCINEKIGIFPETENGLLLGYCVMVNDTVELTVKISSKKQCSGIDALTIVTNSSDKYTDIFISQYNSNGYFDGNVYRYNGKHLKKLYNLKNVMKLSSNPSLAHEQPGNGKIRFVVPGYPIGKNRHLGEYEIYMDFKIANSTIMCTDTAFKTTENYQNSTSLEAARTFTVYKDKSAKKKCFTVKTGDKFYITKIITSKNKITYLMIQNTKGKKGWILLPAKKWIK